jgi:hypothetical protein
MNPHLPAGDRDIVLLPSSLLSSEPDSGDIQPPTLGEEALITTLEPRDEQTAITAKIRTNAYELKKTQVAHMVVEARGGAGCLG